MNYNNRLVLSAQQTGSIVCLGLDPVVESMPEPKGIEFFPGFVEELLVEMKEQNVLPGAFKPNQGFYVMHDKPLEGKFAGSNALANTMKWIRRELPQVPIILDFKRGDIATSSANYAKEGFECWGADAVTIAPYMGTDSVMPFAKYCGIQWEKGVYVLNRTSNKGAVDLQDLETRFGHQEQKMYKAVARKIVEWAKENPGVGAVVGATSLLELSDLARFYSEKNIPLLIPGVGGQGGKAYEVAAALRDAGYNLELARINSSSGITHPWAKDKKPAPADYVKVCVEELHKLNEAIGFKAVA